MVTVAATTGAFLRRSEQWHLSECFGDSKSANALTLARLCAVSTPTMLTRSLTFSVRAPTTAQQGALPRLW